MASPGAPVSDLSRTWLLLRMTGLATSGRVQRLPSVPMQQKVAPMSVLFPPEVPSFTGADWAVEVSLGNTCGGGVGVGAGVLEPPPQPTTQISMMNATRMPANFDIEISLIV